MVNAGEALVITDTTPGSAVVYPMLIIKNETTSTKIARKSNTGRLLKYEKTGLCVVAARNRYVTIVQNLVNKLTVYQ